MSRIVCCIVFGLLHACVAPQTEEGPANSEDGAHEVHPGGKADLSPPSILIPGDFAPAEELVLVWDSPDEEYSQYFADLIRRAAQQVPISVLTRSPERGRIMLIDHSVRPDIVQWIDGYTLGGNENIRDHAPFIGYDGNGDMVVVAPPAATGLSYSPGAGTPFATVLLNHLSREGTVPIYRSAIDINGSDFLSDGEGRCITTEAVADRARMSFDSLRNTLRRDLGCMTTTIVPSLLSLDMMAHVTGPGTVLVGSFTQQENPAVARLLDEAADRLEIDGFTVTRIPMPKGNRSYTNLLVLNNAVLVPIFEHEQTHQSEALQIIAEAYPNRSLIPVLTDRLFGDPGPIGDGPYDGIRRTTFTVPRRPASQSGHPR